MLADQNARTQATNTTTSAIVRAPAGSGKTYLLATRLVALLCQVDTPEDVLALTFGKKATEEIQKRVLSWLAQANGTDTTEAKDYPDVVEDLLVKDKKHNWCLLDNPERLHIKTIDAFCQYIVGHDFFHYSKGFALVDASSSIYTHAVDTLLAEANQTTTQRDVSQQATQLVVDAVMLFHGDIDALRTFLVSALRKRDSWLSSIAPFVSNDTIALDTFATEQEQAITALWTRAMGTVRDCLRAYHHLPTIMQLACDYLQIKNTDAPLAKWRSGKCFPKSQVANDWRLFAELLLTKQHKWRKKIDVSIGMPPASDAYGKQEKYKQAKQQLKELLEHMASSPHAETLKHCLRILQLLPTDYTQQTHAKVLRMMRLLYMAYVYLQASFREQRKIDYTAIATEAHTLLRQDEECLRTISGHYKHLLVDEFQDTSFTQLALLQCLTSEWQQNENTVFFVGDPMQSIYAFREAQVATFLCVWKHGWSHFTVQRLTLSVNFRTQAHLVDWCNQAMTQLFDNTNAELDDLFNSINYSPATASKPANTTTQAIYYVTSDCADVDADASMAYMVTAELNQLTQTIDPQATIAILTRKTKQARALLPALEQSGYQLKTSAVVRFSQSLYLQDLRVLLSLLYFPYDTYWQYALLRTHWFAVSLKDIEWLHTHNWQLNSQCTYVCEDERLLTILSNVKVFAQAIMPQVRRKAWSELLATALILLPNSDAYYKEASQVRSIMYEALVQTSDGSYIDWQQLENILENTQIVADSHAGKRTIEVMTVHKAKGLEFDHVLLPYCDDTRRSNETAPLIHSVFDDQQLPRSLLAVKSVQKQEPPDIYAATQYIAHQSALQEEKRLLYVALTRAKQSVVCFGHTPLCVDHKAKLVALLARTNTPARLVDITQQDAHTQDARRTIYIHNQHNTVNQSTAAMQTEIDTQPFIAKEVQQTLFKQAQGIVIHSVLMQWLQGTIVVDIDVNGQAHRLAQWAHERYPSLPFAETKSSIQRLLTLITQDATALWLYRHRTHLFIEQEIYFQGAIYKPDIYLVNEKQAWIIDFKSATPAQGEGQQTFAARMQSTYVKQMQCYKSALLATKPDMPTPSIALYCPLVPQFIEILKEF